MGLASSPCCLCSFKTLKICILARNERHLVVHVRSLFVSHSFLSFILFKSLPILSVSLRAKLMLGNLVGRAVSLVPILRSLNLLESLESA